MSVSFDRSGVVSGARTCVPVALGVGGYGLAFGVLARQSGLSIAETVLMSAFVFAGAAQLIAVELWASPLPVVAIVLTTFIVNLRYVLMSASLRPWFKRLTPSQAYLSTFFLTDETWALSVADLKSGSGRGAFLLGTGIVLWLFWVATSAVGAVVGDAIANPERFGLDFVLTAIFVILAVGLLARSRGRPSVARRGGCRYRRCRSAPRSVVYPPRWTRRQLRGGDSG